MLARSYAAAVLAGALTGCGLIPVKPDPDRRVDVQHRLGAALFKQGGRYLVLPDLRAMIATDAEQAERVRRGSHRLALGAAASGGVGATATAALMLHRDRSARCAAGGAAAGLLVAGIWMHRAAERHYLAAVEAHNRRVDAGGSEAPDDPPALSARELAPIALLLDAGWNGLAGVGMTIVTWPHRRLATDVAVGGADEGVKYAARVRANLVDGPVSPTLGVGYSVADVGRRPDGTYAPYTILAETWGEQPVRYHIGLSQYVQAVGGVEYAGRSRFVVLATAGWTWRVHDGVVIEQGVPSPRQRDRLDRAYGSGPTVSLGIGCSF